MMNWIIPWTEPRKTLNENTELVKNLKQISSERDTWELRASAGTLLWTDLTHFTCTCDSHNLCAMQTHATLPTAHLFTSEQTQQIWKPVIALAACEMFFTIFQLQAPSIDWFLDMSPTSTQERSLATKTQCEQHTGFRLVSCETTTVRHMRATTTFL